MADFFRRITHRIPNYRREEVNELHPKKNDSSTASYVASNFVQNNLFKHVHQSSNETDDGENSKANICAWVTGKVIVPAIASITIFAQKSSITLGTIALQGL